MDLRQLGKRALECLIKVGALDGFGSRLALLEALDQILSVSTSHFRAAQTGQLSFFGSASGVTEEIELPASVTLDRREQLDWERELLGLYVSDHPLTPYLTALRRKVTHFSGQLGEVSKKDKIVVAGMVTRFRTHQTKDGKAMGFVTLEDIQGNLELVLFPRTWERSSRIIDVDKVLSVEGRVDAEGGDPKILVDNLSEITPAELAVYAQAEPAAVPTGPAGATGTAVPDSAPAASPPLPRLRPPAGRRSMGRRLSPMTGTSCLPRPISRTWIGSRLRPGRQLRRLGSRRAKNPRNQRGKSPRQPARKPLRSRQRARPARQKPCG